MNVLNMLLMAFALLLITSALGFGGYVVVQLLASGGSGSSPLSGLLQMPQTAAPRSAHQEIIDSYSEADWQLLEKFGYTREVASAEMTLEGWKRVKEKLDALLLEARFVPAPAEVAMGEALAWQTLAQWPALDTGADSSFIVGKFTSLEEDQLLLTAPRLSFIDLKGNETPQPALAAVEVQAAWDFNADGLDELLGGGEQARGEDLLSGWIAVYGLDAVEMERLYLRQVGPRLLLDDFDGDGKIDLFALSTAPRSDDQQMVAIGRGGEVLFRADKSWDWPYVCSGDVDGDGLAEYFCNCANDALLSGGMDQQDEVIELGQNVNFFEPVIGLDFTGDGRAEVLSTDGQAYLPASGDVIRLEQPAGWSGFLFDGRDKDRIQAVETADGLRLAALAQREGSAADALCIWDSTGRLVYLEYFGELLCQLSVVTDAAGKQRIVLSGKTRLLLAP